MKDKYSEMDLTVAFGFLASALDGGGEGGAFPCGDAEDFSRGARFIPGEITMARRAGKKVQFITECGGCCWYWEMPDKTRVYHWNPISYERIGAANNRTKNEKDGGFEGGAGPCPDCGNPHTDGGTIKP